MRNIRAKIIWIFLFVFWAQFCFGAQESEKINLLKQNIKSNTSANLDTSFQELLGAYAKENKFDDFYRFLEDLGKNKTFKANPLLYYYKAITRFRQMRLLEENKLWEELFNNKEVYTQDIELSLAKAKELNKMVDALALRTKFLEWQIEKDNEKKAVNILEDLFQLSKVYAQVSSVVEVVRDIADELGKVKQNNYAKKLYNVYISKISETDISQKDLVNLAEKFLGENKVDLAVSLYDVYLDKVSKIQQGEGEIVKQMFTVADKFAHSGWQEGLDPFYADKIYKKIESLYSLKVFDAMSQYRRAYNLERIKEYEQCAIEYTRLTENFSGYPDRDRIYFRLGVLNAYVFKKNDEAKKYFLKVKNDYPKSQDYLNSLYHLGLLDHWFSNLDKAKEFYQLIIENTKELKQKPEIAMLTESRIKEIENTKEIEYNLRMFLEAIFKKKEGKKFLQLELYARSAKDYLSGKVQFQTASYYLDTGCLQQNFTYLWSGQLGSNQNPFNESKFETDYQDLGTKVVNVVLIGPSGVVDGTSEMADIYSK